MTGLVTLLTDFSDVIGWALIHFVWQGTLLAAALALARLLVPARYARARYVAGCLTLAAMLATPLLTAWRLADVSQPASPFFAIG